MGYRFYHALALQMSAAFLPATSMLTMLARRLRTLLEEHGSSLQWVPSGDGRSWSHSLTDSRQHLAMQLAMDPEDASPTVQLGFRIQPGVPVEPLHPALPQCSLPPRFDGPAATFSHAPMTISGLLRADGSPHSGTVSETFAKVA
jgi:hypothetical protein